MTKRSDIYKAIRNKLQSDIPGLTVDVNRGQMSDPKADYPLPAPLALVGISDIHWKTIGRDVQHGIVTVTVDYFQAICSGTFSGAEAEDETLTLLDSPADIYSSLNFFEVEELTGEMCRTREQELRAGGRLAGYRITFEADIYER